METSPPSPHILVVDDEGAVCEIIREYLVTRGFRVSTVGDGQEAFQRIQAGGIDLVLTDLRIPRMDGVRLVQAAREMLPPVPCVVMTAYGTVDSAVYTLQVGASDYLLKPFRMKQVYQSVQSALERHQETQRIALQSEMLALYELSLSVRDLTQIRWWAQRTLRFLKTACGAAATAVFLASSQGPLGSWTLFEAPPTTAEQILVDALDPVAIRGALPMGRDGSSDVLLTPVAQSLMRPGVRIDASWILVLPVPLGDLDGDPPMGAVVVIGGSGPAPPVDICRAGSRFAHVLGRLHARVLRAGRGDTAHLSGGLTLRPTQEGDPNVGGR